MSMVVPLDIGHRLWKSHEMLRDCLDTTQQTLYNQK